MSSTGRYHVIVVAAIYEADWIIEEPGDFMGLTDHPCSPGPGPLWLIYG